MNFAVDEDCWDSICILATIWRVSTLTCCVPARPVVRAPQQRPSVPSFVFPLTAQMPGATIKTDIKRTPERKTRDSSWSETQTSQTPTHLWRVNSTGRRTHRSNSTSKRLSTHHRSNSLSTLDRYATDRSVVPGAFKVVIDRPHTLAKTSGQTLFPTLEVPIPHYRLGTPRFSARGTAFLRSSIYTRTSTNDDVRSSVFSGADFDKIFPVPPGMEPRRVPSRRHSHTSPQPYAVRIPPVRAESDDPVPLPPVGFDRKKEPIVPAVFDELAANKDDPSIVRYSPTTGDITAASPARIIAQVTSENFLDYELLSDFFLTVRSYLSTHDLLAYLVARFEWAVNKFDDDGRVIRVRAFAALRHWILNYFPYDFVVDRELRVQLCMCLNKLSREVRERSIYGASDLKLILDLKRCWNGRCALYWDCATFDGDSRYDVDIIPGGIAGSRNSELSHPSQLQTMLINAPPPRREDEIGQGRSASTLDHWFDAVMEAGDTESRTHKRQISGATVRSLPISPMSEQSIQVLSCSIPAKGLKRTMMTPGRAFGAHPVPATPPNHRIGPAAPSAIYNERQARPKHVHKRSGSFSDAFRDHRAPLPSSKGEQSDNRLLTAFPSVGSMIRGNVFPPGQPYVEIRAPTTPSVELPNMYFSSDDSDSSYAVTTTKSHGLNTPGVKNILGSIRRALSSKQSGSHHSSITGAKAPSPHQMESRKVLGLPANHKCYCGEEREREGSKNKRRADLLVADAAESFQRACNGGLGEDLQHLRGPELFLGDERGGYPSDSMPMPDSRPANSPRKQSAVTLGSQSIPIVDDTGSDRPPMPSISRDYVAGDTTDAVEPNLYGVAPRLTPETSAAIVGRVCQAEVQYEERQPINNSIRSVSSGQIVYLPRSDPMGRLYDGVVRPLTKRSLHRPGPSTVSHGRSFRSTRSASTSLRRYASFQSGMVKNVLDYTFSAATASDSAERSSNATFDSPPTRMLRRRPGGNLRANQNVRELEPLPRPRSTGSITTYTDSVVGSGLYIAKRSTARDVSTYGSSQVLRSVPQEHVLATSQKSPSLVRTHSSQPALRPSFEAAVAEFARIPDDEEGGIEATLLKLEGKYEKIPAEYDIAYSGEPTGMEDASHPKQDHQEPNNSEEPRRQYNHVADHTDSNLREISREGMVSVSTLPRNAEVSASSSSNSQYKSRLAPSVYAESDESYNSIPLLERGLSGRSTRRGRIEQNGHKGFVPQPLTISNRNGVLDALESSKLSIERDSIRRFRHGSLAPTATTDSFLLDEDEDLSDLSSEMSGDDAQPEQTIYQAPASPMHNVSDLLLPTTETNHRPLRYPPSPPMTTENALEIKAQAQQTQEERKPPTPNPSPITQTAEPVLDSAPVAYNQTTTLPSITGYANLSSPRISQHMCFILAHGSETLAEQFTIIEKDALNEIDWRDLVDMRWHHKSLEILNWVDYLRTQDPTGIDLVTARFNIMVKWALSEIVMTQNIDERASTIVKYIHVAQQCRRVHNYATLLQLTIALTSVDCSRLTKTWAKIPATEKKILQDLETLVTPMRNFHNLRREMETANAEEGCIPVVGMWPMQASGRWLYKCANLCIALYIHDLTHNSQKPTHIPDTRGGEPLINFERYRTTASIVKSLLRLIDASAKYTYQPVQGLVNSCLWMATLTDEGIRSRSKELE